MDYSDLTDGVIAALVISLFVLAVLGTGFAIRSFQRQRVAPKPSAAEQLMAIRPLELTPDEREIERQIPLVQHVDDPGPDR